MAARWHAFPTGPIDLLIEGEIGAIEGEVVATDPLLVSPMTDTPCVYWQLTFDEVGAGDWVERARLQEDGEFAVDVTGVRVRVLAHGADLHVPAHRVERRAYYGNPTPVIVSGYDHVVEQARASGVEFAHASSILRATEWLVVPGMSIKVKGGCTFEPDPDAVGNVTGYRESPRTRPVLSGTRRSPLLITTRR